ncbi:DUF4157 domain-containing protein [Tolypothrix bouteillei VB521301_2]|uniref:eCIS core domain-containing protein n=1 Tax=Tolypothrix bouteillei TaxID=1246981 RepID=UPI0005132A5E
MTYQQVKKSAEHSLLQRKQSQLAPFAIGDRHVKTKSSPQVTALSIPSRAERNTIRKSLFNVQGEQIQTKLTIGQPQDKYEQEADLVAAQVVNQINTSTSLPPNQSQSIQREAMPEEEQLQMKAIAQRRLNGGIEATPDLEESINQARGMGQPLSEAVRVPMEQSFGADFSGVRVHADARSDQLNQLIQAKAFTTGKDIFFRQGAYNPTSRGGQELIAHELTHTLQQGAVSTNKHVQQKNADRLIQRTIYIGANKKPLDLELLKQNDLKKGSGVRNIGAMIQDKERNFFFQSEREMFKYANGKTETMGYLEKEDTWIRIPDNKLLVLGEKHTGTTLVDVVKAIGTKKYIYEQYTELPKKLLKKSKRFQQISSQDSKDLKEKFGPQHGNNRTPHLIDNILPKIVVALISLKKDILKLVRTAGLLKLQNEQQIVKGYNLQQSQLKYLLRAMLMAAKSAKYKTNMQELWQEHQDIFNTTAKELTEGVELANTAFIKAIYQKKFTYNNFIDSFKDAARSDLQTSGAQEEFNQFETNREDIQGSTNDPEAKEFERMREYYMYKKMKEAEQKGYLLAGIGDVHRLHLEEILSHEKNIEVRRLNNEVPLASKHKTFVEEQKQKYSP